MTESTFAFRLGTGGAVVESGVLAALVKRSLSASEPNPREQRASMERRDKAREFMACGGNAELLLLKKRLSEVNELLEVKQSMGEGREILLSPERSEQGLRFLCFLTRWRTS